MYPQFKDEEKVIYQAIVAARSIQTFLWGESDGSWGLEKWREMFKKRLEKIDNINLENEHAIIEFKKRLLQNAALSIALLNIFNQKEILKGNKQEKYYKNMPEENKQEDIMRALEGSIQ